MKRDFASLTPQEALHVAVFVEERNAQVYDHFAEMFSDFRDLESQEIAAGLREMAQEERRHSTLLQNRYTERYGNRACALTDADISDVIEIPEFDEGELLARRRPPRLKVLQVALAAERRARQYYSGLSERTPEPQLRDFYLELAQLEIAHEEFLEQKLARFNVNR